MHKDKFKYKLFGRFKGRKKLDISYSQYLEDYQINMNKDLDTNKYNILDIGSGSGENAIFLSNKNSNAMIIACDIFEDGNVNLSNKIFNQKIDNIYLYKGNVLELLDRLEHKDFFNEIWILFPDPWPKKRHHKRRLINNNFIKLIHYFMSDSGKLMIASDSCSYIVSIINTIYNCQNIFKWENQSFYGWNYDMQDLPKTKFNIKALKSNRNSMFFELSKI